MNTLIVVSIQLLIVLNATNPLCNNTNITIDSAFVDKYCDLGSDVITLFADNTVYQLTVNARDPMNPVFKYNRSQSLNEWSNGDYHLENVGNQ
ncbi:unnamed protein product [Medioppia subpectinata]|uniref:Uncharacterized protein n=1 Tax=Medioppia subpectinata TaxID=1979941 RepID=A0A7R9KV92_9ACAR|nr:unnamed protein product [Medioppia subpectinata]CAG2110332.1 unnamed protein product [Medioppia subpectinata]